MNKLLRQFSSDEFDELIKALNLGTKKEEELEGVIDVSSLVTKSVVDNSTSELIANFQRIYDQMAGNNLLMQSYLQKKKLLAKEMSMESASVNLSNNNSKVKDQIQKLKTSAENLKRAVKNMQNESSGSGGIGSVIGLMGMGSSKGLGGMARFGGLAIGATAIGAAAFGLSQYENFGFGVPSRDSLGDYANATADNAMGFFMSKGWTKEQAAGIVGNLMVESGNFDSKVISGERKGDGGRAVGIAQWHPDRQANFRRMFGKSIIGSSFQEQLEFVNWELNNSEKSAGNKLRKAKSTTEAAIIVDKYYERSSGQHRQLRIQRAAQLLQQSPEELSQSSLTTVIETSSARAILGSVVGGEDRITSGFGMRVHPITGERKMHSGIDVAGTSGTRASIFSIDAGTVDFAGTKGGYGKTVDVNHGRGRLTRYAHLSDIFVREGERVQRGQVLGKQGSTGRSTGNHLHFEYRVDGRAIDPMKGLGDHVFVQPIVVRQPAPQSPPRVPLPARTQSKRSPSTLSTGASVSRYWELTGRRN